MLVTLVLFSYFSLSKDDIVHSTSNFYFVYVCVSVCKVNVHTNLYYFYPLVFTGERGVSVSPKNLILRKTTDQLSRIYIMSGYRSPS